MKSSPWNVLREMSAILAGFKLAVILIGYFGAGSLAKWIIEQWYPFTRWLWENVFAYLRLPEITDVEKDALTAIAFFLPLGIAASVARLLGRREETAPATRVASASLGIVFVYAICSNVILFVLANAKLDEQLVLSVTALSENVGIVLAVMLANVAAAIGLGWVMSRAMAGATRVGQARLYRVLLGIASKWPSKVFVAANRTVVVVVMVLYGILGLFAAMDLESYLPLAAIVLVSLSVLSSIFYTPTKLMLAAGASLAFISAAYAYEMVVWAKGAIEGAVP